MLTISLSSLCLSLCLSPFLSLDLSISESLESDENALFTFSIYSSSHFCGRGYFFKENEPFQNATIFLKKMYKWEILWSGFLHIDSTIFVAEANVKYVFNVFQLCLCNKTDLKWVFCYQIFSVAELNVKYIIRWEDFS